MTEPLHREPEAEITGPHGRLGTWHATYTEGVFILELGDVALTRRGIERKARRLLARIQRAQAARDNATTIKA